MNISNMVASNVKNIREQKKITLNAAAEMTGVSRSMLAQIEKGDVNPTIPILWKIANGLKVSFTSLLEDKSDELRVVRNADIIPLIEDSGKYINYPVFSFDTNKLFECYRIVIKADGILNAQPHLKGAEEYITVFAGDIIISVDGEYFQLGKGDSIRFRADVPHGYKNNGGEDAEINMLIYYNG